MRRTTQWAVFTSMNQQQPAWRSMIEPPEPAEHETAVEETAIDVAPDQPLARPAPDTRRDRVDLF